jgi:hypothetical protein
MKRFVQGMLCVLGVGVVVLVLVYSTHVYA